MEKSSIGCSSSQFYPVSVLTAFLRSVLYLYNFEVAILKVVSESEFFMCFLRTVCLDIINWLLFLRSYEVFLEVWIVRLKCRFSEFCVSKVKRWIYRYLFWKMGKNNWNCSHISEFYFHLHRVLVLGKDKFQWLEYLIQSTYYVTYWNYHQLWLCFIHYSLHHSLTGECLYFITKSKQTILCYQHNHVPWCIAVGCGWRVESDVVLQTSVRLQHRTAAQRNWRRSATELACGPSTETECYLSCVIRLSGPVAALQHEIFALPFHR